MDLPAPVSPVITVNPFSRSIERCWTTAKFLMFRCVNTQWQTRNSASVSDYL
ncbi:Ubiquinone biosynthesis monooxygenase UbiB [gamma proteobacterium IMCC2047]|nr:Ubiquinone biosynthesis monooxygenase UbiB [gamma proteobacterium IMCC2047]